MRKLPLSITLTPFEKDVLDALAVQEDRSMSWIVGAAVEFYAKRAGPFDGQDTGPLLERDTMEEILQRHGLSRQQQAV